MSKKNKESKQPEEQTAAAETEAEISQEQDLTPEAPRQEEAAAQESELELAQKASMILINLYGREKYRV